jgi:hypothetical protein
MRKARVPVAVLWLTPPVMVVALLIPAYFLVIHPFVAHRRWYGAVEYRILCLAERCPGDLDRKQWAACIHWTWNLHANYGALPYWDKAARYPFLSGVDQKLRGKVDLGTIDWIWDQYSQHTSGGKWYSENFRPTTPERLKEASLDRYGEWDLDAWLEQLRRRRAGVE